MYNIFETAWITWRNQTVRAILKTEVPVDFDMEPHWWNAEPITAPFPKMVFAVNKRAPIPDNYMTNYGIDLYSEKLVSILDRSDVKFEVFPVTLVDYKTDEIITDRYFVFHLLEMYHCADMKASEDGNLVLTDECLREGHLFFRLAEGIQIVLIHQDLQRKLEKAGITGCQFQPLGYRKIALRQPRDTI